MSSNASNQSQNRPQSFGEYVRGHKVDFTLWILRLGILVFFVNYLIPIFGWPHNFYRKILVAQLAVSCLRLYQRLPPFQCSREYLSLVMKEDSCHYLLYCVIFINAVSFFAILMPVVLFAILHFASESLKLLEKFGCTLLWPAHICISIVELQSINILRVISLIEIFLMPFSVFMTLSGKASILTPIIYYNFLVYRYSSHRNPYTRNMFHELRVAFEQLAMKPATPIFLRSTIQKVINFVSRLKPQYPAA